MRILLVEDEKRMAQALCEILIQEKYEVDHFDNGTDGLDALLSDVYDMAVRDVMLPGKNGFEIAKQARADSLLRANSLQAEADKKENGHRETCGRSRVKVSKKELLFMAYFGHGTVLASAVACRFTVAALLYRRSDYSNDYCNKNGGNNYCTYVCCYP